MKWVDSLGFQVYMTYLYPWVIKHSYGSHGSFIDEHTNYIMMIYNHGFTIYIYQYLMVILESYLIVYINVYEAHIITIYMYICI